MTRDLTLQYRGASQASLHMQTLGQCTNTENFTDDDHRRQSDDGIHREAVCACGR